MDKKYIIFDFDGTLVNTNEVIVASWQATYDKYLGWVPERKAIEATFGETLKSTILRMVPDAVYEEVRDYYRAFQDANCQGMVAAFEGVRDMLIDLREREYRLGVATSRTTKSFTNYMRDLELMDLIDEAVTIDDVTSHKPHPESATAVLAKLAGLDPREPIPAEVLGQAIMIGDTKYDIGCAMNAGIDSVLVGYSHYVDEDDMRECGFEPTYRIERPGDLFDLLKGRVTGAK